MSKKINSILKEVLEKVKPKEKEINEIKIFLDDFLEKLGKKIKASKINAEIFVGGSFVKKTAIKKDKYDIDIFIRFDKKYRDKNISELAKKVLSGFKNLSVMHGSRDYFVLNVSKNLILEIIPVIKVKNPKDAENITDLSYSHVKYINKKLKSKKIYDEILLAKAFCYANNCYGAESHIRGFSGYSIELLIYHYSSFIKFVKEISKHNGKDKVVIDIEKQFKNKQEVLRDLNSSKLNSPIILIDPTYKQRNALAALSEETLEKFKENCIDFIKKPSKGAFEIRKINFEKIKTDSKKKGLEFVSVKAKTSKQKEDVAGSKLLKFYHHLAMEIEELFHIKGKEFVYPSYSGNVSSADYLFSVKSKKDILVEGPKANDLNNVKRFKERHKNTLIKKGRIYAREKINYSLKKFLEDWKSKNKKRMNEMYISEMKVSG